jgi:hypothetical protein
MLSKISMNFTIKLYSIFILSSLLIVSSIFSIEFNPWDLSIDQRVLDRKTISQIVIDPRVDEFRLVLIASERYPYNFKTVSFAFFFRLATFEEANQLMHKIDRYLESGQQMTVKLDGSEIKGVIFHEPYEKLP